MGYCYRKIYSHIWTDEKFSALTGEQQRIALYILTAQVNRIGLFLFSPGKAAEELRIPPRAFNAKFRAVCTQLRWQWDAEVRIIFIPTWWKYNAPESWNNMAGNLKDLAGLPRSPLLDQFAENTVYLQSEEIKKKFVEALGQALDKGYPNPSPQPSPNPSPTQEQEQDLNQDLKQEQKLEQKEDATAAPLKLSLEEIRERWNAIPGVRLCKSITGMLSDKLTALTLAKPPEFWDKLFAEVRVSKFLTEQSEKVHQGKKPFYVSLDWISEPKNLAKILAGNFDDSKLPKPKPKLVF